MEEIISAASDAGKPRESRSVDANSEECRIFSQSIPANSVKLERISQHNHGIDGFALPAKFEKGVGQRRMDSAVWRGRTHPEAPPDKHYPPESLVCHQCFWTPLHPAMSWVRAPKRKGLRTRWVVSMRASASHSAMCSEPVAGRERLPTPSSLDFLAGWRTGAFHYGHS